MLKKSVLSLVVGVSVIGGVFIICGTPAKAARQLNTMEAERLTYSALVSDSDILSASSRSKRLPATKAKKHFAKPVPLKHVAYRRSTKKAAIKRAVFHRSGSYLLNRLSHLRHG